MTIEKLAEINGYEIRHHTESLKNNENFNDTITPFDFSQKHGGTINSFKYYNNYYLIKSTHK